MDHVIKVKIADKVYRKTIHSEEEEAAIRKAVSELNDIVSLISKDYTKVTAVDIMTIAALNIGIEKVELRKRLEELDKGYGKLSADLQRYVDSLK